MKTKKMTFCKILTGFLIILLAVINVMFAFVLKMVIDSIYTGDVKVLAKYMIFAVCFLLGDVLLTIIVNIVQGKYIKSQLVVMKNDYYEASLYNRNETIVPDLTTKMEQIYVDNLYQKFNMLRNVTEFIVALASMIYISWVMTLGIILVTLIPMAVPALFSKLVSRRKNEYNESNEKYINLLNDTLIGWNSIRNFNLHKSFLKQHETANEDVEHKRMKSEVSSDIVDATSENLGFLTFLAALGIGSYYAIKGDMSFGMLIAAVQLMNNLMQPLNGISRSMNRMNSVKEVYNSIIGAKITKDENKTENVEDIKAIQLKDISYSIEEAIIINKLNYKFEKGKKYALVGASGSGKSTLLKLLCGELKLEEGDILYNDLSISSIRDDSLAKSVVLARQDVFIFRDDIINNITLWDESKNHSSLALLNDLNLPNDNDFVSRNVDNSDGMSEGQRQRIGLARVMEHSSSVLLFDEVTSSLDSETAKKVMEYICSKFADRILIFVTHSLEDLKFFNEDEIINLEKMKK